MQDRALKGTRIAHVGIALKSMDEFRSLCRDVLELESADVNDSDGATIEGYLAGESLIELMTADGAETPVGKFVAKRGPGIHHVCFSVDDLKGTLQRCRDAGIRLVDEEPRVGAEGKLIAFIHPASTGGVLIELSEY